MSKIELGINYIVTKGDKMGKIKTGVGIILLKHESYEEYDSGILYDLITFDAESRDVKDGRVFSIYDELEIGSWSRLLEIEKDTDWAHEKISYLHDEIKMIGDLYF